MPTKWYLVIHGRLTSERSSLHFPSSFMIINHSTIACCSSVQTPNSLSNTWTLDRLRTRRRVGSTRRRGNHMHVHSRFQRDIDWRHRRLSLSLSLSLSQKSLTHNIGSASALPIIPKTIGNRKRDCAWGCARGINTTWDLQIEKHKSVPWAERTPTWFVLFDLQIFSGGVYPSRATSRTISFFYFQ